MTSVKTNPAIPLPERKDAGISTRERRVIKALRGITNDSLWAMAIQRVVQENDATRLHELIRELQEQNNDNPRLMKAILEKAYPIVMSFKTVAENTKSN